MSEIKRQQVNQNRITAQDDRIKKLRTLLGYYREITDTIREPFIILDQDLYVVSANLAFYKKFKVSKKDTEGKLIYELGNNQWDAPDLRKLLERILPSSGVFSNFEVTHNFPKIGTRTMLLNARQVDSKQLILLAMEDVTALNKLKTDSDELTTNLTKQRDKLRALSEAKDEFISLASHQLRTPLTAVKQYLGMLTQGYAGEVTKSQMGMLNIAYKSNERQLEIIDDLLRVARVDDGKVYLEKSKCDIAQLLETVIEAQSVLFTSRGQTVVFNKPKQPLIAYVDQKLMFMVLENLLDNAGKYSKTGAKVTIDAKQNTRSTIILIKDNGIGISKVNIEKLFKKFARIHNPLTAAVVGSGLGLYWAKKILDLHKGSIKISSKAKSGSTFTVTIPTGSKRSVTKSTD